MTVRTKLHSLVLCVTLIMILPSTTGAYSRDDISEEKKLIQRVLEEYQKTTQHGRPVRNISDPVQVKFGLGLIQMELDEKMKALCLSIWSKYIWTDEYLRWEPSDYSNISSIKLETKLLWLPDIMLYNTAETDIHTRSSLATVHSNGTVLWVPHQNLKSSCSIDVTSFPFDKQQCHMWFGSWTYTTNDLNLTMAFEGGIDMSTYNSDFKDSSQWEIVRVETARKVLPSTEEEPNYAVLTYTLELKRNLVFASYILTLPCVFLACLTLVVFWLPPDRPDRTSLAMSIFASFLLLLLILVEAAPPTASSVPLLGIYYCFNMVIIMLAIFLSSLVVNICRMGDGNKSVPPWLRRITLEGPLRFLTVCSHVCPSDFLIEEEFWTGRQHTETDSYCNAENASYPPLLSWQKNRRKEPHATATFSGKTPFYNESKTKQNIRVSEDTKEESFTDGRFEPPGGQLSWNISVVKQSLLRIEEHVTNRVYRQYAIWRVRKEWMCIAVIMDRMFFVTYVILIVVSITTLFPRP